MKYYVTYKVEGRYIAEVEADSLEEARDKASSSFSDADFGELSDIDGEDIIVEDKNGNYVQFKVFNADNILTTDIKFDPKKGPTMPERYEHNFTGYFKYLEDNNYIQQK